MSKTLRAEPTPCPEAPMAEPAHRASWYADDDDRCSVSDPAEAWTAPLLRAVRLRAVAGPWRRLGGVDDYGVVHGTEPGAHRYYWAAHRGRSTIAGTVIANSRREVERWLREELRAIEPAIARDRLILMGIL